MSSFGRTEKIIFILAIVSLMVFSYFLYDDSFLFSNSNNAQLELIGDVTISQNDVRRKNVDTFSWLPALTKDKVFQNDSIFTGDRSEATIHLNDGTQIKIQPNSLITLNLKNGQMNLDLRYGNLVSELAQESSLVIKSGTEEIKLENTKNSAEKPKIQFKKSHSGHVDLKLISGDAKYSTKTQQVKQELPKKSEVSVANNGEIKEVEKPTIILKTADNAQWLKEKPNDPISFDWEVKGKASKFKLEISTADTFDSIILSRLSTAKTAQVTDPLKTGTYFWRLKALDQYGDVTATSIIQKFGLTEIEKPEITTPKQASQFNLELKVKPKEIPVTTTEIQWTAQPIIKTFVWQLAQDEEFKNLIIENKTTEFTAVTPKLQSGTYWVRVQGQTESYKFSPWSQPISFSLNLLAQKEEPPKKPILITKTVKFSVPTNSNETVAPKLAWKPVQETKEYHLEISPDNTFKMSEKYKLPQTQVSWKQYRPGKYFFRVYAVGINELPSEYSDTGIINVNVGEIALSPIKPIIILDEKALPQEAKINWNEIAFAKKYVVQMDESKNFLKPVQLEYTANNGKLSLPGPGRYNVRVQALDENNKPLTPFSKIEQAQYILNIPLTSPVLSEPFDKASIFLQTQMEPFIWLEWNKVPKATTYKIEISNKKDFSTVLIRTSLKENRYLIKDKMPLGKIYWRVRAIAAETSEQSLWTPIREFTLHHQKNETLIK